MCGITWRILVSGNPVLFCDLLIVCSSSANLTEFLQLVIDGRLISFLSIPSNIRYLIPGHSFDDDDHEMKCFFFPKLLITVRFSSSALSPSSTNDSRTEPQKGWKRRETKAKASVRELGAHRREIHLPNRD